MPQYLVSRSFANSAADAGAANARTSISIPDADGFELEIGVPETSVSTGTGNVYFSMSAPTTYAWVGFGTGSAMGGSSIFLMYQDGNGNVTLSPRSSSGYSMPSYNEDADVEVLEGTGIEDGEMTVNFRCGNCETWDGGELDFSGTGEGVIAAWKEGSLESDDSSASISQHDGRTVFSADFAGASIAQDANPFAGVTEVILDDDEDDEDDEDVTPVETTTGTDSRLVIHGIVMAVTFAVLYPAGAFLMPLLGKWMIHAGFQMFAFVATWVGFATGYMWADEIGAVS